MPAKAWFYLADGKRHGPVEPRELVAKLCALEDPRAVPVWAEGMSRWTPAGEVEGLVQRLPPPVPVAAPAAAPAVGQGPAPPPGPASTPDSEVPAPVQHRRSVERPRVSGPICPRCREKRVPASCHRCKSRKGASSDVCPDCGEPRICSACQRRDRRSRRLVPVWFFIGITVAIALLVLLSTL